jgi:hypothetical protein
MAEPKQRQRPKGGELRDSLRGNPEQSYRRARRARQLQDRLTEQDVKTAGGALAGSAAGAVAADVAGSIDPYLSRNEFKEGFYDQPKPPVSYETLKGTAAKPIPNVTDTESFADGGSVRGQKNIQVKKKQFRGVF